MRKFVCFALTLPLAVNAATLTQVPMQGGMLMPAVTYSNSSGRVHVVMPVDSPQLTPLLVSNPVDNFDPADPWYQDLDPSREGRSFSRRYGFNKLNTNQPPAGTAFWIRKLSGPPELEFFRYSGSAPKAWEPIFGTDGTTNGLSWNQVMFHPAITAPVSTNPLTATFEVVIMDTNLMQEVADSSSGPLVFNFTNSDDGRPDLGMGYYFALSWATNATNWVVESAASITATNWTALTNAPTLMDGGAMFIMDPVEAGKMYRMRRNP
jgi:hypothetical protein